MFEGLVNLLPILKDLAHTSPNVELLENKKKKKNAGLDLMGELQWAKVPKLSYMYFFEEIRKIMEKYFEPSYSSSI
jgi:hypothetical protein